MYDADNLPRTISIGFTGEKDFRVIEFDMTKWLDGIPGGTPAVVFRRPGETAVYRPEVSFADGIMTWTVAEDDVTKSGKGKAQLEMKSTAKTRKSAQFDVQVHPAIMR